MIEKPNFIKTYKEDEVKNKVKQEKTNTRRNNSSSKFSTNTKQITSGIPSSNIPSTAFLDYWYEREGRAFKDMHQIWFRVPFIKDILKKWLVEGIGYFDIVRELKNDSSLYASRIFLHLVLRNFYVHKASNCNTMDLDEFNEWIDISKIKAFIDWFNENIFKYNKIIFHKDYDDENYNDDGDDQVDDDEDINEEEKNTNVKNNEVKNDYKLDYIDEEKEESESIYVKSKRRVSKNTKFEKDEEIDTQYFLQQFKDQIYYNFISNLSYDQFLSFFEHYLVDGWSIEELDKRITSRITQVEKRKSYAWLILRTMGISTPRDSRYKSMFTYNEYLDFLKEKKDDFFDAFRQIKLSLSSK